MTTREETIHFLNSFVGSLKDSKKSQLIARYMLMTMVRDETIGLEFILSTLFQQIDSMADELEKYISYHMRPYSIQISADTEEGKQFIRNFIEMQNKKGDS